MDLQVGGVIGLIGLALSIWALISIVQSGASTGAKVVWVLFVLLLPIVGFIAWLIFGPRKAA